SGISMRSRSQSKWRVLVGDEYECIGDDTVVPASDALQGVEEAPWVAGGEEDREPGDDDRDDGADEEEEEHDVVRDREEPLDERKPAIEPRLRIRVGEFERDRLALVGRRIAVVHQRQIDPDPIREAKQLAVPVVPPAGVFLAEDD